MRFCGNCGAQLAAGETRPATEHWQGAPAVGENLGVMMGANLIERLRQAGVEASGQRRKVSVLFADLSDYTTLASQLDSEDVYALISQFIQRLVDVVYQYEGIVDKLTGDGLMALFGAPIAHENNAERAVRAAIDMQARLGELNEEWSASQPMELKMRVGLNSGTVVVGGIGSNLLMDYTAIGDTVNLARRIQEAAPVGSILVSEAVYRQTKMVFRYQSTPALPLKGYPLPVHTYRLLRTRSEPANRRGIEGLRAPLIGRERELEMLKELADRLARQKTGRFILVTGEAGIGKSRLTAELKHYLHNLPIQVLEGSSLTYRRSVSYWMFLDLLRDYLGVTPDMAPVEVGQRLSQRVRQTLGQRAPDLLPYLEHLLAIQPSNPAAAEHIRYLDAGQLRQQIFLAVRDLLVAEATQKPLVIILEDLHWADEASLDLLQFLASSVRQAPLILYLISRPFQDGPLTQLRDWAQQNLPRQTLEVPLRNLSTEQSSRLLQELLAIPQLPPELGEVIVSRSEGVPFYLEEFLRALIDEGVLVRTGSAWQVVPAKETELGLPQSLQELVLARFDRLSEFQRQIIQTAAMIGNQFSHPLLVHLMGAERQPEVNAALDALVAKEFIHRLPYANQAEYAFRHAIMSEAVYSTILKRERIRLHADIGRALEILYADRLEETVDLLARHFAWSQDYDRAVHYLILAGEKAARSFITTQARRYFEQALEILPQMQPSITQILRAHSGLGDILVIIGDYPAARTQFQTALQAFEPTSGEEFTGQRCALHRQIARTYERQGDYDHSLQVLSAAQQLLVKESSGEHVEHAQILNDMGWIYYRQGNLTEAETLLQKALRLVENSNAFDAIASIYNRLGGVAYHQGNWSLTADYLRKSIAIRESIGDVAGLATSFNNLGLLGIEMGDFNNALENLSRSYELKSRLGQAEGISMTLNNLGWLRIQRGDLEEAERVLSEALELAQQIGYSSLISQIQKNYGELFLARGAWEPAHRVLLEAIATLGELKAYDQLADAYRLLGEAALGAGDFPTAESCMDKILNLTSSLGDDTRELSSIQRGEFWRFRGMLSTQLGDYEAAATYLKESERVFQALGSRLHQGRSAYQLGLLAVKQGDRRNAQLRFREAALALRSVGASLEEERADQAYQQVLDQQNFGLELFHQDPAANPEE